MCFKKKISNQPITKHTLLSSSCREINSNTVEHAKFVTLNCCESDIPGIVATCNFHILRSYKFRGSCYIFFAWRLIDWLRMQSCDVLKFGQLKAYLFIQDKTNQLITHQRTISHLLCSLLTIEFIKQYNCFIIFPTLDVFFPQLQKLSTWFLHYWKEENLLYPVLLHDNFVKLFYLVKNAKMWCNELFILLKYIHLVVYV